MRKNVGDLVLNVDAKTVGFEGAIGSVAKLGLALEGYKTIVNSVAEPIKNLINSFSKQEDANISLTAALKSTGQYTVKAYKDLQNYANQLQKTTVVGNETSLSLMQMAINMGLSKDKAKEATKDAIALNSAFGIDLKTALRGSSLALQGQYSLLARYVPQLRGVKDETDGATKFQKAMADAFKIAEAKAGTFSGKMQQLNNSIGDLKEIMGGVLADQLKPFIEKLKNMAEWANNNSESVKKITKAVEIFGGVLATIKVTQSLTSLATFFSMTLPAALNMSKVAAIGVQGAIGIIALELGTIYKYYRDMKSALEDQKEAEETYEKTREEIIKEGEDASEVIRDTEKFKTLSRKKQLEYLIAYGKYLKLTAREEKDPTVKKALETKVKLIEKRIAKTRELLALQKQLNKASKESEKGSKDSDKSSTDNEDVKTTIDALEQARKNATYGNPRLPSDEYMKPDMNLLTPNMGKSLGVTNTITKQIDAQKRLNSITQNWASALENVKGAFDIITDKTMTTKEKITQLVTMLLQLGLQLLMMSNPATAPFAGLASSGIGAIGSMIASSSGTSNNMGNEVLASASPVVNIQFNNPLITDSNSYFSIAKQVRDGIDKYTFVSTGELNV